MKKPDMVIEKKFFITTSKDNILNHYDFHPKVIDEFDSCRNWVEELMGLCTRPRRRMRMGRGGQLRRYQRGTLRTLNN